MPAAPASDQAISPAVAKSIVPGDSGDHGPKRAGQEKWSSRVAGARPSATSTTCRNRRPRRTSENPVAGTSTFQTSIQSLATKAETSDRIFHDGSGDLGLSRPSSLQHRCSCPSASTLTRRTPGRRESRRHEPEVRLVSRRGPDRIVETAVIVLRDHHARDTDRPRCSRIDERDILLGVSAASRPTARRFPARVQKK
jgi:hypothetical protein